MKYDALLLDTINRLLKLERDFAELKETVESLIGKDNSFDFKKTKDYPAVISCIDEDNNETTSGYSYSDKPMQRDKTRYLFNGNVYLKNKLVLAVVKEYVAMNITITGKQLIRQFNRSLQGSIGVVEYMHIAQSRKDYGLRFFSKDEDVLHLVDGDFVVCSQWGILNINNFIKQAEVLGFEIEKIEK